MFYDFVTFELLFAPKILKITKTLTLSNISKVEATLKNGIMDVLRTF